MIRLRVLLLLVVVLAIPAVTRAQLSPLDSSRVEALRRLSVGQPIRVRTIGQSVYAGPLIERTDTSVVIRDDGRNQRAQAERIAQIWRRGNNAGRGALTGGIIGGLLGGVFIGFLAQAACESTACDNAFLDGVIIGIPIGGATGAAAGALIGAFVPRWKPYWP